MSLNDLAVKYEADKQCDFHGYVPFYEKLFEGRDIKHFLEIGINKGASHLMWLEYFSEAMIYGIDLRSSCVRNTYKRCNNVIPDARDRLNLFRADQSSPEELEACMGKIAAPLDVILDDGSHKWSHQIISFETLWPHVSTGGVYIVEDTITSYWPESKRNYNDQEVSCVEYFKSLVDDIVLGSKTGEATVHKGYLSYSIVRQLKKLTLIQHTVESIQFLNGMIIVRKREVY